MAARIRVLDAATIDKIAAGEVIERPASVVKELVENSLDAGASSIYVSVEDGGRRSISVKDDGCGMSREDAQLSLQRYATSKISSMRDLAGLSSFGFRGEALSSIGAVSKTTLRTREHDSDEGTVVTFEGGKLVSASSAGCPAGTEVTVEDLFYNIPARRKSMKSKNVELGHCREVIVNYMLSRAGLSFSLSSDGETELVHVTAEGMTGSLAAAFGAKAASNMLHGDSEGEHLRVEAHLGRLEHTRSSSSDLKLFVNDRPVRSTKIVSGVVGAYGSRLMKDRYPIGVVRLFADGSIIDVNVHPTKREVRFDDEGAVIAAVERCVKKALESQDISYKYDLTKFAETFQGTSRIGAVSESEGLQTVLGARDSEAADSAPFILPIAQIMGTYILAESRGNLLLIDQHAASERIVYESILSSIESGKEISQTLLTPLVVNLTATERRVMEENRDTLEKSGYKVEPFGRSSFALRSLPTVLGVAQGESSLRNLLGDLAQISPDKKLGLEVIWRVACHTAIRAGDPLSQAQMRQLVSELMRTKSPFTCEHGRPTMIVLSPEDLEKLFKRRA